MDVPFILAVDFDGTLAEPAYPDLGEPKPYAGAIMRKLKKLGYFIIIWTCREGEHVGQIEFWLKKYNIPFDLINEHHPLLLAHYKNNTRKIMADIYIDDKNLQGLPGNWLEIYHLIQKRSLELQSNKALNL